MAGKELLLGVDVGTGSVRAGMFTREGRARGVAVEPIRTWRDGADFVEQSSDDIWRAAGVAVRGALAAAGAGPDDVLGIGFDATCSLVALDTSDRPVTVSPSGDDARNVVVWMDHRATPQAERINAAGHPVLRSVGGTISPEMETPKLLWLKEHLPTTWSRTARFLDLPDFLVFRATGVDVRSLCTTVCKWTYVGDEGRWDESYFRSIGLGDLADEGWKRIGTRVRPQGELAGPLTAASAAELGLRPGIPVAVAIIDAHAGGLGLLGCGRPGEPASADLSDRVALIGGTSTCHMAVSPTARHIPGIWGPYPEAMVPGAWLTEGGQSATGALIDHVIASHARGAELAAKARAHGVPTAQLLNERLDVLARGLPHPGALAAGLHVQPDFHGNRSPRADPSLRGMISGLALSDDLDALAVLYLATIQGLAHGTRHVIDTMNAHGYAIRTLVATGGDTRNPVFVREHADATGCAVVLPREREAVLLGAAILGAVAAGVQPSVAAAMAAMNEPETVVLPNPAAAAFHAKKHAVFQRMTDDQLAYRALMQLSVEHSTSWT